MVKQTAGREQLGNFAEKFAELNDDVLFGEVWSIINWYDAIVLDCIWFCHSRQFIIKGTEDMVDEYHNYWFHIKGSVIGEIIGLFVCLIVGVIVTLL